MTAARPDVDRIIKETFVATAEYHDTLASTNDPATPSAATAAQQFPPLVGAARQPAGRGRAVTPRGARGLPGGGGRWGKWPHVAWFAVAGGGSREKRFDPR